MLCVLCSAEAADQLGTNGKLVERLVEWCEAKDHAGVMGESNRLLSALIRHSKSKVRNHATHALFQTCPTLQVFINSSLWMFAYRKRYVLLYRKINIHHFLSFTGICLSDHNPSIALFNLSAWLYGLQEVVRTVIQGGGVKHLVTMATSEHMIMQNEALVALGLIAGLDLGKCKNGWIQIRIWLFYIQFYSLLTLKEFEQSGFFVFVALH